MKKFTVVMLMLSGVAFGQQPTTVLPGGAKLKQTLQLFIKGTAIPAPAGVPGYCTVTGKDYDPPHEHLNPLGPRPVGALSDGSILGSLRGAIGFGSNTMHFITTAGGIIRLEYDSSQWAAKNVKLYCTEDVSGAEFEENFTLGVTGLVPINPDEAEYKLPLSTVEHGSITYVTKDLEPLIEIVLSSMNSVNVYPLVLRASLSLGLKSDDLIYLSTPQTEKLAKLPFSDSLAVDPHQDGQQIDVFLGDADPVIIDENLSPFGLHLSNAWWLGTGWYHMQYAHAVIGPPVLHTQIRSNGFQVISESVQ